MCVCIVSGVNELQLSHDQKAIASITTTSFDSSNIAAVAAAVINGDIDKIKLDSVQPYQPRRNWWSNTNAAIQKDLFMNADGRYECPRDYCRKTYKEASSLQRHIRCVCFNILNLPSPTSLDPKQVVNFLCLKRRIKSTSNAISLGLKHSV